MKIQQIPGYKIEAADMALAKMISDTLNYHYPGWGWGVHVDSTQGIVQIINLIISGSMPRDYGYMLKMKNLKDYRSVVKNAVLAGGESLERAGVKRGPYTGQEIFFVEGVEPQDQPL